MTVRQPKYSQEELARCGDEIYESQVRSRVEAENHGNTVVQRSRPVHFQVVLVT